MADLTVYAVEYGDELPAEIDSLWQREEDAKERAAELNADSITGRWKVMPWTVAGPEASDG